MNGQAGAEIFSIGTELLMGETVDTNAGYLSRELRLLGIRLNRVTVAGDERGLLCDELERAIERSDVVIASGGLGPTEDDLTRECVAQVLGEELFVDAGLEKQLRALFQRMGREMPAPNLAQAMLIPSATSLPNANGTAPGWWVEKNGKVIVLLPGPPREMKPMWQDQVRGRLRKAFPGEEIATVTLKVYGMPEATVAGMVEPFFKSDNPALGIYARTDGIHLRLIARGRDSDRLLQKAEGELREIFTHHIWGKNDDDLPEVIGRMLDERHLTLATMEGGSHGYLASILGGTEATRKCYLGSLVVSSGAQIARWGIPADSVSGGLISTGMAEALAALARERFSADIGLGTTDIVGLDCSDGRPVGLAYIGSASTRGVKNWQHGYPAHPDVARHRLAMAALFRLRRSLLDDWS